MTPAPKVKTDPKVKTIPNPQDARYPLQAEGEYQGVPAAEINAAYLAACRDPEYRFGVIGASYPHGYMPLVTQAFCARQYAQRNELLDPKRMPRHAHGTDKNQGKDTKMQTLIPWLTEEKPDKTRRRRICLGCGDSLEYAVKQPPAVSYVAWVKAHLPCGELYTPGAAQGATTGVEAEPARTQAALPECPECSFAGVELRSSGVCTECETAIIGAYCRTLPQETPAIAMPLPASDARIAAFMERTGCTRAEVQAMIDTGQITLRGPKDPRPEDCGGPLPSPVPRLAVTVPALHPGGDPCTFVTQPGALLRRGNGKQARSKKQSGSEKSARTARKTEMTFA